MAITGFRSRRGTRASFDGDFGLTADPARGGAQQFAFNSTGTGTSSFALAKIAGVFARSEVIVVRRVWAGR